MAERDDSSAFYITTPIYYVSGDPHIGSSYTTIAADVVARYHRLRGEEVVFATGTDEHGQKVLNNATEAGKDPQAFTDELVDIYKRAWERLEVDYDRFIRTTEAEHVTVVQSVFERLREQDDIYESEYSGWYCVPCETYFQENELVDGCCPDCHREVEQVSEETFFFRTSKYADDLVEYIEENEDFIQPESRRNEVLAFIRTGLRDTCITRGRSEWDIPVPGVPEQSIYVWFDALINYLTVAGYTIDDETFDRMWPPDVQLMGKDILTRFHATFWPAMLMALDLELPRCLFAHGWWNDAEGQKMSKSRGNVVDPFAVIDDIVDHSGVRTSFAVDTLRYYLLREVPFGLDGNFSHMALFSRFNADLANDLGNLLNRTLPLVERYVDGKMPDPGPGAGALDEETEQIAKKVERLMSDINFREALETIWDLTKRGNKFLDEREPWTLHKEGKYVELNAVLTDVIGCLRSVAIMIAPFMPSVSGEIWKQIGLVGAGVEMKWEDLYGGRVPEGTIIQKGDPIFPRVDLERLADRLQPQEAGEEPESGDIMEEKISFDDFTRLDLRMGKVLEANRVPNADKLLVLKVDIGEDEPRQVVAGLAEQFNPRELIDKTVVLVANLEPAEIRGTESNGMILAAGEDEPLAIITADREVPVGEKVR
ncbi:MAG: methionine--tRNA ligase [Armatimonadota bacterium]